MCSQTLTISYTSTFNENMSLNESSDINHNIQVITQCLKCIYAWIHSELIPVSSMIKYTFQYNNMTISLFETICQYIMIEQNNFNDAIADILEFMKFDYDKNIELNETDNIFHGNVELEESILNILINGISKNSTQYDNIFNNLENMTLCLSFVRVIINVMKLFVNKLSSKLSLLIF